MHGKGPRIGCPYSTVVLMMTLGLLELSGVALSPADWSFRHVWQIGVVFYVGSIALAPWRYGFR